jgi:hypothetical protein
MITKRETSAFVTNDISLDLTYENLQESKCKPQASRGTFTQRKKGKSKGMGTHLLKQI